MANWFRLERMVDKAVDSAWSEQLRIFPVRQAVAVPGSTPVTIKAILMVGSSVASDMAGAAPNSGEVTLAAGEAHIFIDRSRYPALDIREGYSVRAIDRDGQPWFYVRWVDDRDTTRISVRMGEA
jgi:hypothetical protein